MFICLVINFVWYLLFDQENQQMETYLTKRPWVSSGSSIIRQELQDSDQIIDKDEVEADPGKRSSIASYDMNIRDQIHREYVAKGPFFI